MYIFRIIFSLSLNYLYNYLHNYVLINLINFKSISKIPKKNSFVLKLIDKYFVHILSLTSRFKSIFIFFLHFNLINHALIIIKINHKKSKNMPFIFLAI